MNCYFYLKNTKVDFKSNEIKDEIKKITDGIVISNFLKNDTFSFTLTKKDVA